MIEKLPDNIKIGKDVYWLLITKNGLEWTITYCIVDWGENEFRIELPPILHFAGGLTQIVNQTLKRLDELKNKQPKATNQL